MYRIFPVVLIGLATFAPFVAAADPLSDRIAVLSQGFRGTVMLYAKNLSTGREVGVAPDTRVRTASTIKLPILCALESLVAAGKVKWDERIILKPEDKVSGSGVLASLEDHTELSVRNLAILMIILSDNTATNLILDRIGADAVNDYLDTIGLVKTRANRKVRGDGTKLAAPSGWSKAGLLEDNKRFGLGVSTPREMVRLLELLNDGKIVGPDAIYCAGVGPVSIELQVHDPLSGAYKTEMRARLLGVTRPGEDPLGIPEGASRLTP